MTPGDHVLQLFPLPGGERPIRNLYLDERLRERANAAELFVYANFVSSMDGRIGVPRLESGFHHVPSAIANPRDWRLYQELAAQADVLITSARYFRQLENNEAQDMLPVGREDEYDDLRQWRHERGLTSQPDIAVLTSTGDLPLAALEQYGERRIFVFAGRRAATGRIQSLERAGAVVSVSAADRITGDVLVRTLGAAGLHLCYAIGGPEVMHTLVAARVLDRLYLTLAHCLLAGTDFATILRGDSLEPAASMNLRHVYYDQHMPEGSGQWLSAFDFR